MFCNLKSFKLKTFVHVVKRAKCNLSRLPSHTISFVYISQTFPTVCSHQNSILDRPGVQDPLIKQKASLINLQTLSETGKESKIQLSMKPGKVYV